MSVYRKRLLFATGMTAIGTIFLRTQYQTSTMTQNRLHTVCFNPIPEIGSHIRRQAKEACVPKTVTRQRMSLWQSSPPYIKKCRKTSIWRTA